MNQSIFIRKEITLHSGQKSDFKIEADSLSDSDIATLAYLISQKIAFKEVIGVPTGGLRLAAALHFYKKDNDTLPILIVDDVLTTGRSMVEERIKIKDHNVVGVVIFARGECPYWIQPIFQMWK